MSSSDLTAVESCAEGTEHPAYSVWRKAWPGLRCSAVGVFLEMLRNNSNHEKIPKHLALLNFEKSTNVNQLLINSASFFKNRYIILQMHCLSLYKLAS